MLHYSSVFMWSNIHWSSVKTMCWLTNKNVNYFASSLIFKAKCPTCVDALLKCEDLLLLSVLYNFILTTYEFCSCFVRQTKQAIWRRHLVCYSFRGNILWCSLHLPLMTSPPVWDWLCRNDSITEGWYVQSTQAWTACWSTALTGAGPKWSGSCCTSFLSRCGPYTPCLFT